MIDYNCTKHIHTFMDASNFIKFLCCCLAVYMYCIIQNKKKNGKKEQRKIPLILSPILLRIKMTHIEI